MTDKTITLACPFCGSKELKQVTDDGVHFTQCKSCEATGPTGFKRGEDDAIDWNTRAALADPVPPAGGEPEVLARVCKGHVLGWGLTGYLSVEIGTELVDRAHVAWLQAEVERLGSIGRGQRKTIDNVQLQVERLQSELTKALEDASKWKLSHRLAMEDNFKLTKARELLEDVAKTPWMYDVLGSVREYVANQSAPADKGGDS